MNEQEKLEWVEIFGAIEKLKESQIKLHDLFKNGKNEETKQENRV